VPVSATVNCTYCPVGTAGATEPCPSLIVALEETIVSLPLPGMASRAFTARFNSCAPQ
jgi:hypothetical protein